MNLPRRLAALPLAFVLFWMMVVTPWTMARCEHACGEIRLHALGTGCFGDGDTADCDHCPDSHAGGGDCQLYKGDDAVGSADQPDLHPPLPGTFTPNPVVVRVWPSWREADCEVPNVPPLPGPPRETHGRGALPLLF